MKVAKYSGTFRAALLFDLVAGAFVPDVETTTECLMDRVSSESTVYIDLANHKQERVVAGVLERLSSKHFSVVARRMLQKTCQQQMIETKTMKTNIISNNMIGSTN